MNKIPLVVMNSHSPQGKSLNFETVGIVIFPPGKKVITIVIYHLGTDSTHINVPGYIFWQLKTAVIK